ncbi:MAG: PRC-barrel domain-containing protein [Candidatus ainarchaeum sp.]|jgi:sporulation protein YlmC with PRC-barrel domain|nr:PRC-barrel domain-containing protein [Candidatus ainarchaeum sp.]
MTTRISKLFGMDIYQTDATYRGKVHDLIVNIEQGVIETITTQPLKVNSKIEAKKIITEHSIPYNKVISADDIILINAGNVPTNKKEVKMVDEEVVDPAKSKDAAIRKKYIGYKSKYSARR